MNAKLKKFLELSLTVRLWLLIVSALLLLLLGRCAAAANAVTISNDGKNPATLTWSTTPDASSCTASGGWSGTKSISGSELQAQATASTLYTLSCTWAGDDKAALSWTAPAANTDGSTPADVQGYNVYQDDSASPALSTASKVAGGSSNVIRADQLTYMVTGLAAGAHNFSLQAWTCSGDPCQESDITAWISKANTAQSTLSASTTLSITATPKKPRPPQNQSLH